VEALLIAATTFGETLITGGAAATIGVVAALVTERYRERRLRRLAQPAARSVLEHTLMGAAFGLLAARRNGQWWPPDAPLPTPGLELLSTFVTDARTSRAWQCITMALMTVDVLNRRAAIASITAGETTGPLTNDDRERAEGWLEQLLIAIIWLDRDTVNALATADSWSAEGNEDIAELNRILHRLARDFRRTGAGTAEATTPASS
jgi:hypothetical protein